MGQPPMVVRQSLVLARSSRPSTSASLAAVARLMPRCLGSSTDNMNLSIWLGVTMAALAKA